MIRTDSEYQAAVARVAEEKKRIAQQKKELKQLGLAPAELKRALDPIRSFHLQLVEEIHDYERLRRGAIGQVDDLRGLGRMLVRSRIAKGLSQRELAQKLEVHESQISRDERNEYHGITLERASRILEALGIEIEIRCSMANSKRGKREAVA